MNKNNESRVKNYIVTHKQDVCDYLEMFLCKQNISYVRVDNEFHFNDQIYRFYSMQEAKVLINKKEVVQEPKNFIVGDSSLVFEDTKIKKASYNKQKIKTDNRRMNQKLKAGNIPGTIRTHRFG